MINLALLQKISVKIVGVLTRWRYVSRVPMLAVSSCILPSSGGTCDVDDPQVNAKTKNARQETNNHNALTRPVAEVTRINAPQYVSFNLGVWIYCDFTADMELPGRPRRLRLCTEKRAVS